MFIRLMPIVLLLFTQRPDWTLSPYALVLNGLLCRVIGMLVWHSVSAFCHGYEKCLRSWGGGVRGEVCPPPRLLRGESVFTCSSSSQCDCSPGCDTRRSHRGFRHTETTGDGQQVSALVSDNARCVSCSGCVGKLCVVLNPSASTEVVCFSVRIGVCADSLSESGGRAAQQ